MSGKKHAKRKKSNALRYLTFAIVIAAIAGLGIFFYNKNFNVGTFLPLIGKMKGETPPVAWTATLCFGDETGEYLVKEHRIITSGQTPEQKADALLQELLKGPISRGTRTLPQRTHSRGIDFDKGILTIDFSSELKKNHPGGSASEILTVYGLVDTMALNIPEAGKVQLLVEGKKTDTIAGHIDCTQPIAPRLDLVH